MQKTGFKCRDGYRKGYAEGQRDIIPVNWHTHYCGFTIQVKTPKSSGTISENQSKQLSDYAANGYKTLVSNDYDFMLGEIEGYVRDVRVRCPSCRRLFKIKHSLSRGMR